MFKKILSLVLVVALALTVAVAFSSCEEKDEFKVGFICLHDENSTYDKNFLDAAYAAQAALGLSDSQVIIVKDIPETDQCYQTAADLVDQGCDVIFANSFGHEDFMIQAAKAFPDVEFCHATGTKAHTENLPNYHNAFASIYEGRYLAGVAAGLKLNELIANGTIPEGTTPKMGYIGAFTYAEVMSGYTSFYLGARSVCPNVVMDVTFTGSWFDLSAEREAANNLIASGCHLISQHADSMGAPSACEAAGIPNVAYNGSTVETCENTFIVSSKINWQPYFTYMITNAQNGTAIDTDWTGTLQTGSVQLTAINEKAAAEGTAAYLEEVKAKLISGEVKVFDITTFTVGGVQLDENTMADVDDDGTYTNDTKVVSGGAYEESKYRSAPYFNLEIDGITLLDRNYGE